MPDRAVTMRAVEFFLVGPNGQYFMNKVGMAVQAVFLHDSAAHVAHLNRFVEILPRQALGMPESVFRRDVILAEKIVLQMAIHAFGDGVMPGLLPSVVLRLHDLAVDAGF